MSEILYSTATKKTCYSKGLEYPSDAEFEYYNDKFIMITFYIVMGLYFVPLVLSMRKFFKTCKFF